MTQRVSEVFKVQVNVVYILLVSGQAALKLDLALLLFSLQFTLPLTPQALGADHL